MTIPPMAWLVGATRGTPAQDATADFVAQGIWECNPSEDARNHLSAMQPGDRIAIKSAFVTLRNLPFDNRGLPVSTMRIKAIGTIREVQNDACKLHVDWDPDFAPREWYFYTFQKTFRRLESGTWKADALLNFAFNNAPQDYDTFRNDPYWADRFGDKAASVADWVPFHEALADQLLTFAENRGPLIAALHTLTPPSGSLPLRDQVEPGRWQPLEDICPFTVLGLVHRGKVTAANQRQMAGMVARAIGLDMEPPVDFPGVPRVNNQTTWFFSYTYSRQPDDIDSLWNVFVAAATWNSERSPEARVAFVQAFDRALQVRQTKWNLTFGLFWYFPRTFLPLDSVSRAWLKQTWNLPTPHRPGGGPPDGETYLAFCEDVQQRLAARTEHPTNFIEFAVAAFQAAFQMPGLDDHASDAELDVDPDMVDGDDASSTPGQPLQTRPPYTLPDILHDGAFQSIEVLEEMLSEWKRKKNLILQGAPGTGKTWLAQRLGWALVGVRKPAEVVTVQFHPGVSYEDFVRGYRPGANERFEQVDGPFMRLVAQALANPHTPHVLVIEEINRGNPAHIFGELLTLIEASKRAAEHAMELTHPPKTGRVAEYVPPNLYLVGTMNLADRSIALVDVALRRRFAFFTLEPQFNDAWRNYLQARGVQPGIIDAIRTRLQRLNDAIASDARLGSSFVVGHSFVTPTEPLPADDDGSAWFRQIVRTEIQPLLEEYCFDSPKVVKGWCDALRLDRA